MLLTPFVGGCEREVPSAERAVVTVPSAGGGMLAGFAPGPTPRTVVTCAEPVDVGEDTGMRGALGRFGGSDVRCGGGGCETERTLVLPPRCGGGTG